MLISGGDSFVKMILIFNFFSTLILYPIQRLLKFQKYYYKAKRARSQKHRRVHVKDLAIMAYTVATLVIVKGTVKIWDFHDLKSSSSAIKCNQTTKVREKKTIRCPCHLI